MAPHWCECPQELELSLAVPIWLCVGRNVCGKRGIRRNESSGARVRTHGIWPGSSNGGSDDDASQGSFGRMGWGGTLVYAEERKDSCHTCFRAVATYAVATYAGAPKSHEAVRSEAFSSFPGNLSEQKIAQRLGKKFSFSDIYTTILFLVCCPKKF